MDVNGGPKPPLVEGETERIRVELVRWLSKQMCLQQFVSPSTSFETVAQYGDNLDQVDSRYVGDVDQ